MIIIDVQKLAITTTLTCFVLCESTNDRPTWLAALAYRSAHAAHYDPMLQRNLCRRATMSLHPSFPLAANRLTCAKDVHFVPLLTGRAGLLIVRCTTKAFVILAGKAIARSGARETRFFVVGMIGDDVANEAVVLVAVAVRITSRKANVWNAKIAFATLLVRCAKLRANVLVTKLSNGLIAISIRRAFAKNADATEALIQGGAAICIWFTGCCVSSATTLKDQGHRNCGGNEKGFRGSDETHHDDAKIMLLYYDSETINLPY